MMQDKNRPLYSALYPSFPMLKLCLSLSSIEREWRAIVGGNLARRSAPIAYEDGVLVVSVDSQAVMQDMNFRKAAIIREIRLKAYVSIQDIRLQLGRVGIVGKNSVMMTRSQRQNRAGKLDENEIEMRCKKVLSKNEDMDPALARIIARCQMMCENEK